jgi:hypothetical protein
MGTDIHCWVEKMVNGTWLLVQPKEGDAGWSVYHNGPDAKRWEDTSDAEWALNKADWDIGRDYDLFAILADVRNGRGFADVRIGDGFEPILSFTDGDGELAHCRGWPEDRCTELKDHEIEHSPSWLSLRELQAFNWSGQIARKAGVVILPDYVKWRDAKTTRAPERYSGGVMGPSVETLRADHADRLLAIGERTVDGWKVDKWGGGTPPAGHPTTYVDVEWLESYDMAAHEFHAKHLPSLAEVARREGVSSDDLRIVFYFDS